VLSQLRSNAKLRAACVSRGVSAHELVTVAPERWDPVLRAERRRARAHEFSRSLIGDSKWRKVDADGSMRCPKCASRELEYHSLGERREARKNDVWGSKDEAPVIHMFRCTGCAAQWRREGL
jgi:DNA-directed RNA polymerase subunit M/transcription elongation factor TFIIS